MNNTGTKKLIVASGTPSPNLAPERVVLVNDAGEPIDIRTTAEIAALTTITWKPNTAYTAGTIVSYQGNLYSVNADYTSGSSWTEVGLTSFSSRYAPGFFTPAAFGTIDKTGVVSSYQPIADAVAAALAAGGGTVLLPEGTLLIGDNTITVPAGVSIVGAGRSISTIKSTSSSGKDVLSLTGSRTRLANFRIQGASGGGYAITLASGTNRVTLESLQMESAGAGGVKFTQSNFLVGLFEVEANSVTGNGFDVLGAGTHNAITFIACYANSCTGNGFQVYSAKGVNLVGCSADNNGGYGYQTASARVNFNGCTAEANTTGGYYVVGSGMVKLTMCSTSSQLLPVFVQGSAETRIESLECTSTPSGHCVTIGASGTNVRNQMVGGTLDRSVSITSGGYLIRELSGTGSPEGVVVGSVGSTFRRVDGGALTSLYVKESGFSNTGWVGK